MTSPRFRALPGEHRKVYSNRSEADFVMPSSIRHPRLLSSQLVVVEIRVNHIQSGCSVSQLRVPQSNGSLRLGSS